MLPSTKVKSPPPAGIRGTFMKREGWWRAFLQTENGVSLSVSPRFINPFFVVLLTTTAGEDHAPRKNLPRRRFNFVYSGMPPVPWRRKGIARDHASSFQRG